MMHDPITLVARNMTNVIAKHSSIKNDLNKIDPIINNLKISFIFTGCNGVFILSETQKKNRVEVINTTWRKYDNIKIIIMMIA